MAAFTGFLIFFFFFFVLRAVSAAAEEQGTSFSFTRFDQDPYFRSNIALIGDSRVVNGGSAIQLTGSSTPSAGRAMFKKPIKIVRGNSSNSASFSTHFTFSMSRHSGDGFAFVMGPSANLSGNSKFGLGVVVAVEFDTTKSSVGIDSDSLVKSSNVSSLNLVLNSGQKLQCWIDYEARSRRLEVRLAKLGGSKPQDPILSHQVDLWKLWKEEAVVMGLSSSNQTCFIYSWSFKLRSVPHWLHSQPLDPNAVVSKDMKKGVVVGDQKKSDCFLKVLAAMIFGTATGALGSFVMLYLWAMFGSRRPVAPEEVVAKPMDYDYKKVDVVVVDKAIKE